MALFCIIFEAEIEKCRDLEIQLDDHSRSLKIALFDRSHLTGVLQ